MWISLIVFCYLNCRGWPLLAFIQNEYNSVIFITKTTSKNPPHRRDWPVDLISTSTMIPAIGRAHALPDFPNSLCWNPPFPPPSPPGKILFYPLQRVKNAINSVVHACATTGAGWRCLGNIAVFFKGKNKDGKLGSIGRGNGRTRQ